MSETNHGKKPSAVELVWNTLKEDKIFVSIVTKSFMSQSVTDEELKQQFCNHPAIYLGLARQQGYDREALKKYIKLVFDDSVKKILEKNKEHKVHYLKPLRKKHNARNFVE